MSNVNEQKLTSSINPKITEDFLLNEPESRWFDRKQAAIRPSDLAEAICGFANADGGTIAIGLADKPVEFLGINAIGEEKISALICAAKDNCKPMPGCEVEFLPIVNCQGLKDRLLLIHIQHSVDQLISTKADKVFLRIADKTKEMRGEQLRQLEYSKAARHFESEVCADATLKDLDEELLEEYKQYLGAKNVPIRQVLKARGFLLNHEGKEKLTNGAVLLFAKNIFPFYPNCRIRFLRYEGLAAQVGTRINIVKDQNFDLPILRLIPAVKDFIATQLRDFMALDRESGQFVSVPEYPEFAWEEGIVNAVAHREYGLVGDYIKVCMFDDRLEIRSPGRLPSIVTLQNIRDTRYSRNPKIARVLSEFGWVRELNEGVKRIYSDMAQFFLDDPIYSEPEETAVQLTLRNNCVMRFQRKSETVKNFIGEESWQALDNLAREILTFMVSRKEVTRNELEAVTRSSQSAITNRIRDLIARGIVKRNGNPKAPNQTYSLSNI